MSSNEAKRRKGGNVIKKKSSNAQLNNNNRGSTMSPELEISAEDKFNGYTNGISRSGDHTDNYDSDNNHLSVPSGQNYGSGRRGNSEMDGPNGEKGHWEFYPDNEVRRSSKSSTVSPFFLLRTLLTLLYHTF